MSFKSLKKEIKRLRAEFAEKDKLIGELREQVGVLKEANNILVEADDGLTQALINAEIKSAVAAHERKFSEMEACFCAKIVEFKSKFDALEAALAKVKAENKALVESRASEMYGPYVHICPITQEEIHRGDHIGMTVWGNCYDYEFIQKFMASGENLNDPLTNERLPSKFLIKIRDISRISPAELLQRGKEVRAQTELWAPPIRKTPFAWINSVLNRLDDDRSPLRRLMIKFKRGEVISDGDLPLRKVRMSELKITEVRFKGVDLSGSDLSGTIFTDCVFSDVKFLRCDLTRTHFNGCTFSGEVCFSGAWSAGNLQFTAPIIHEIDYTPTTFQDAARIRTRLARRMLECDYGLAGAGDDVPARDVMLHTDVPRDYFDMYIGGEMELVARDLIWHH